MIFEFLHNGEVRKVELKDGSKAIFADSGNTINVDYTPDRRIFIKADGISKEVYAVVNGGKTYVDVDGSLFEFAIPAQNGAAAGAGGDLADPSKVFAPMPGKVVKVMVEVGQEIAEKTHLAIVEAMKMEHICVAKARAKVMAINFAAGDQVDTDTPLIELELIE